MNADKITLWIDYLGKTHTQLLADSAISDEQLIELFPGIDELYLEPETGVAMTFRRDGMRYKALTITLQKTTPSTREYAGNLPSPYSLRMSQSDVHRLLGEPSEYSGPVRMPEPVGQTGGWEYYHLDPEIYPNHRIQFQYLESMEVKAIVFSLIDKSHN